MQDPLQQIDLDYYRAARLRIVRAELEQLRQESQSWSPASVPRDRFLNQPRFQRATNAPAHSTVPDPLADK